ncbi:lipoprotein signal peptidase [Clostridia bacterium]|nr:lipoprotein signal peptidase [Clostridia bacterium]
MIYLLTAIGAFFGDLFLKQKADENLSATDEKEFLKGRIIFRKHYNRGAIFDSLQKWPDLVRGANAIALGLLSIVWLLFLRTPGNAKKKLGGALMVGGGAGNLYDRLKKGYVVDYFSIKTPFPKFSRIVFNLSDLFLFIGSALVLFSKDTNNEV